MADKSKKIGGISQYKTFGRGENKTSPPLHVESGEIQDEQTSPPQSEETSGHKDEQTIQREDAASLPRPAAMASQLNDVKTHQREDVTTSLSPDTTTFQRLDQGDVDASRQKDVSTFQAKDVASSFSPDPRQQQDDLSRKEVQQTQERSRVSTSSHQDETTFFFSDVKTSGRSPRNPEKEAGRQTVYFEPALRQRLRALVFLENRDISEVVSDAVELYIEQSPQRDMIPVVLAAQKQRKPKK